MCNPKSKVGIGKKKGLNSFLDDFTFYSLTTFFCFVILHCSFLIPDFCPSPLPTLAMCSDWCVHSTLIWFSMSPPFDHFPHLFLTREAMHALSCFPSLESHGSLESVLFECKDPIHLPCQPVLITAPLLLYHSTFVWLMLFSPNTHVLPLTVFVYCQRKSVKLTLSL